MDGVTLGEGDYTAHEGSTVITFALPYLQTLAKGGHDVRILFDDGAASSPCW